MNETDALAILRSLAACTAHDPYQKKPWAPTQFGKWMTVNVPAELWQRVLAAATQEQT